MKTEEYLLKEDIDFDITKIKLPQIDKKELELIEEYVEFTRHIQEIDQLFHIFKVNLQHLLFHYELMTNDTVIKKDNFDIEENDGIIINALVINYISSARTFVESVETFVKETFEVKEAENFKKIYLSKLYDEKFTYRFLYSLRNYSQHGHLPVYIDYNNKCSFNLDEILNTPHFDHNSKLKEEMEEIREQIIKDFKDNPRIMFTRTIAEFQIEILEIYESFINYILDKLIFYYDEINNYIKINPNIRYKSKNIFNGYIMYEIREKSIHCFNPDDNPVEMTKNIHKKLINELKMLRTEFDDIFKMKVTKKTQYRKL